MEDVFLVILRIIQIIVAVLLITAILLQVRTQELGGVFGGGRRQRQAGSVVYE